ncbi:Chromo domain - like 5 [Theobroma cacao]|nr:Chromo domain - like 5 [Theobroma cacao]
MPRGLLNLLSVLEKSWDSVSMDFIMGLPKVDGFGSIMVVVDKFSKYATFISAAKECPTKEAARLLGSKLYFSTNNHLQTNGQTEWVNVLLELYLRHFMCGTQTDWPSVGDIVMVKLHLVLKNKCLHKGLVWRYEGPYQVVKRVGKVVYKLDLPLKLKVHPVFYVSMLKPYHGDEGDLSHGVSHRAPSSIRAAYDREVEKVFADKVLRRQHHMPQHQYLVKWKGLPESEASWESMKDLWQFQDHIDDFHMTVRTLTCVACVCACIPTRSLVLCVCAECMCRVRTGAGALCIGGFAGIAYCILCVLLGPSGLEESASRHP